MRLFGSRKAGLKKFYEAAAPETATLVSARPCNVLGLQLENNHSAAVYLQFFNADDESDVTVGTTSPDWTVMVPANDGIFLPPRELPLRHFDKGLVIAATSSREGAGAVAERPTVSLDYVQE